MTHRILIVDDEPNIVKSLEFLMQRAGFDVEVARTGNEALAAIDGPPPALLLLDVMMPDVNGYEICQRIRQKPAWNDTLIVMLTAKGSEAEREKGLALGANDYISKPFSTRELVERVKHMLGVGG